MHGRADRGSIMNVCGARTRRGGWGSDHKGSGRCRLHGGSSTGRKNQLGNKGALKHGRYEYLYFDYRNTKASGAHGSGRIRLRDGGESES